MASINFNMVEMHAQEIASHAACARRLHDFAEMVAVSMTDKSAAAQWSGLSSERIDEKFAKLAALLGYTVIKAGDVAENRLLKELKVERGVYAMQAEPYTARALDKIIKEFEAGEQVA